MHSVLRTIKFHLVIGLNLLVLSACNWVDSTGIQGTSNTPVVSNATSGLNNARPFALQEELPVTANLLGQGAELRNWTWSPIDTDVRNRCAGIEGFDSQLAVTTLSEACTHAQECSIAIEESSSETSTRFTIRLPQLRAPVSLGYSLSTVSENGTLITREQPLCGISVNEAPLAVDDNYIALNTDRRFVDANDPDSLLANDRDDIDIRNQILKVDPTPVQMPRYAAEFTLGSDGSFLYSASNDAPLNENGFIDDSFVYAITDGLHRVEATAVVKIVSSNQAPRRRHRIPDLQVAIANNQDQSSQQQIDLSAYFTDPDGDPLFFSIRSDQLPPSGNISISPAGLFVAVPGVEDLGRWRLTAVATDGLGSSSDVFNLTVLTPEQNNLPPIARDISNRIVQNTFSYDVSVFFSDPNNDPLSFSAIGLPSGVSISNSGLIQGTASDSNSGDSFVLVTANDNRGGTATDGFRLIIN